MGTYSINCPSCGNLHVWFSGNQDQRCAKCQKPPREFWITKEPFNRQIFDSRLGNQVEHYHVIEKWAFDAQVKVTEKSVDTYNTSMAYMKGLLETEREKTRIAEAKAAKYKRKWKESRD